MSETSPNKILIDNFNKLIICKEDELSGKTDPKEKNAIRFKVNSFKKVLKQLELHPNKIESSEQVKDIKGFGKGTLSRIDEILETGTLKECSLYNTNISSNNSGDNSSRAYTIKTDMDSTIQMTPLTQGTEINNAGLQVNKSDEKVFR